MEFESFYVKCGVLPYTSALWSSIFIFLKSFSYLGLKWALFGHKNGNHISLESNFQLYYQ